MPVDRLPPGTSAERSDPDPHASELADLSALVLGLLPEAEADAVREHLSSCPTCRAELPDLEATAALLGGLPPEAFLDGPPDDAELLISRTVQAIRHDAGPSAGAPWPSPEPAAARLGPGVPSRRRMSPGLVAAAAAALLVTTAIGILGGRFTATPARVTVTGPTVTLTASPSPTSPTPVPGTLTGSHTDPETGARLEVTVAPEGGWVRLAATAGGIRARERCRLVVVDRAGHRTVAGSWLSGGDEEQVTGSALVEVRDVEAVRVENTDGRILVTTRV